MVNRPLMLNFLVLHRQWQAHGQHQEMGSVPASAQTRKSSPLRFLFHSHSGFCTDYTFYGTDKNNILGCISDF